MLVNVVGSILKLRQKQYAVKIANDPMTCFFFFNLGVMVFLSAESKRKTLR